ncbi:hypothetical protein Hdeb2414_s0012g00381811 [Helianthus debilis subsp. tardiflorus]
MAVAVMVVVRSTGLIVRFGLMSVGFGSRVSRGMGDSGPDISGQLLFMVVQDKSVMFRFYFGFGSWFDICVDSFRVRFKLVLFQVWW